MSSAALKATDASADVASGQRGFDSLSPLFEVARGSVRTACAALEPDSLSGPEAVSVLTSVVEMLRVATSAKLALASRIEATGVARESGYRNAAAQLADIEGVGVGAASATLLTAERLRECPAVGEGLASGELSEQQAKTIAAAAVLAPDREDQLIEAAHRKSITELGDDCRRIRAASAKADPMATYQAIHAGRSVRHWCDEQGALCLQGRFTPDVGARLVASLDQVANEFFEAARASGSKEPLQAYRADALVALVAGERDPSHSGATINVRVDHAALLRGYPVGTEVSEIEESGPLPIPKVIDLMSDAGINVIFSHGDDISRIFHFTRTSTPRCSPPSRPATRPAWCPAAGPAGTSRSTIWSPSPTGDPPPSPTWPACAASITVRRPTRATPCGWTKTIGGILIRRRPSARSLVSARTFPIRPSNPVGRTRPNRRIRPNRPSHLPHSSSWSSSLPVPSTASGWFIGARVGLPPPLDGSVMRDWGPVRRPARPPSIMMSRSCGPYRTAFALDSPRLQARYQPIVASTRCQHHLRSSRMPEITLVAEAGRPTGTSATRRLRAEGKIPGVVYGHGTEAVPVSIVARDFRIAMSGEAGLNTLLSLQLDGKSLLTLARDIQRHPVKNVVSHVDFLIVRRDEVIAAEVTINLVGEAIEIQHGDGVVDQQLFTLSIKAKPADIPPSFEIDISDLIIGGSLHVSDIAIPAGVEVDNDPDATVVAGQPPRVQITPEEEAAEAALAAEAAGEVVEGEAPADAAEQPTEE